MYIALLIPLLGTILGSAFVFFMKEKMSDHVQKSLLGFASGVMVAASVWSLLIPGMDMCEDWGEDESHACSCRIFGRNGIPLAYRPSYAASAYW